MTQQEARKTYYIKKGEKIEMRSTRVVLEENGDRIWEDKEKEDDGVTGGRSTDRWDGAGGNRGTGQG